MTAADCCYLLLHVVFVVVVLWLLPLLLGVGSCGSLVFVAGCC